MKIITLGIINSNLWYIFLMSLFDFCSFWTNYHLQKYCDEKVYTQVLYILFISIAQLLAIIPEIILKVIISQSKKSKPSFESSFFHMYQSITSVTSSTVTAKREFTWKKAGLLFLLGIINTVSLFFKQLIYTPLKQYSSLLNDLNNVFFSYSLLSELTLVFISILYLLIFRNQIHRHHYLRAILLFIGSGISYFGTPTFFSTNSFNNLIWIKVIVITLVVIIQALIGIGQKWLMQHEFITPYLILFSQGLVTFICSILRMIFNKNSEFNNLQSIFYHSNLSIIFCAYFNIILYFLFFLFTLMTIDAFSPTHVYISPGMSGMFCWLFNIYFICFYEDINMFLFWISAFTYPLWFIGCLLYNELLIFNFCSLDEYTSKRIMERELEESINYIKEIQMADNCDDVPKNIIHDMDDNGNIE